MKPPRPKPTIEELLRRRLVTVPEAGQIAGVSRATAYRLADEGRLPGVVDLPGHHRLVKVALLVAWLDGRGD
jgi:excisionase family DNA binding protein